MDRYQETIDRMSVVKRFIIPVMSDDAIPGRPRRYAVQDEDLELIAKGRACSECLAVWESPSMTTCPFCKHERSANDILDGIAEWDSYIAERQHALDNPVRTATRPMHEMIDLVASEALGNHVPGRKRNL